MAPSDVAYKPLERVIVDTDQETDSNPDTGLLLQQRRPHWKHLLSKLEFLPKVTAHTFLLTLCFNVVVTILIAKLFQYGNISSLANYSMW